MEVCKQFGSGCNRARRRAQERRGAAFFLQMHGDGTPSHDPPPPTSSDPPYRFEQAIAAGRVSAVQKIEGCCILAAVGQGMVNRKGSAATMMSALAAADVNIKALAQVCVCV